MLILHYIAYISYKLLQQALGDFHPGTKVPCFRVASRKKINLVYFISDSKNPVKKSTWFILLAIHRIR